MCTLEVESCEALLLKNKLYYEVGQLRTIYEKHRDAVHVYSRLHLGEYKQRNVPQSDVEAAVDVFVAEPESQDKIVYEHSIWIMKATTAKQALRIFMERKSPLSSRDVFAHLPEHLSERDHFAAAVV